MIVGAHGHLSLAEVVLRHPTSTGLEHDANHVGNGVVGHEFDAHHGGDRITREVVVGGTEAAAHDHGVGRVEQPPQLRLDASDVVADLHLHQ